MSPFLKIYHSVRNALRGLTHAYRVDKSFHMEAWGGFAFLFIGWFAWPLSAFEFLAIVFSYGLILITELINTSVEQLLERLHPEHHETIGRSKDIASASVLVAFVLALFTVCVLLYARLV